MGAKVSVQDVFKKNNQIVCRKLDDDFHLLIAVFDDVAQSVVYEMNDTSKKIWSAINNKNTVQDIVKKLAKEFQDVPESKLKKDVLDFISKLYTKKIILKPE